MTAKRLTVLGSTGSIGTNTLDIVRQFPDKFQVTALSCHNRIQKIHEQIEEFQPQSVCVGSEENAQWLKARLPSPRPEILSGTEGLIQLASNRNADLVVAGIVGAAGLRSTYAAIENGRNIALANKETMVLAGELIMAKAKQTGSLIFPADSEHNAIYQSLIGHQRSDIEKIILTASGGPFRDTPLEAFQDITLDEALNHPNWEMGSKITIDSATMMNKGLEIIEARWLFDIPVSQIEPVIHRESIVHSLVEYTDGSFIAQMGLPDMRTPIAFCLAYPDRLPLEGPKMKMSELGKLHFAPVPFEKFPCLSLAITAANLEGAAPAVLNGANEAAVAAYLDGKIHFMDIARIISEIMEQFELKKMQHDEQFPFLNKIETIEDALDADQWGRQIAQSSLTGE
ncbi:MAG: 1-deoxy-D-xylulose-5-phosphate reductoisomerase [SAR324 cluster bacterium]|nr:1-deoxy-D-xylulose-5-phosphate reductoisomerase [SAR324 cluster bacterium]